jgi:hypothetical protein
MSRFCKEDQINSAHRHGGSDISGNWVSARIGVATKDSGLHFHLLSSNNFFRGSLTGARSLME